MTDPEQEVAKFWERGTVIQITNENHHWYPALLIVDEPKDFGCVAYMINVTSNDPGVPNDPAYIRLKRDDYEIVGHSSIWAVKDG